jgi:TonB family protein
VALDQFKTQVLLLHSEQYTLDFLSSGFGKRYTVHCATSGAEALTTLDETPINVIISAQKLPGMSGIEALREAKKRFPETIGILLVGNADKGLEALVGDKEVFQIVHGEVTAESLTKLVDNATQQMRLMALAESANDTAADMDEPSQHIVMETSENGSTIISDGTGRFPGLRPDTVAAATSTGAQLVDVLVLTKDRELHTTIVESSRGMHKVHYADTLKQADDAVRKHKVGVAVIDAAMVGQKIEQLTMHLRKGSPRLVAIVAGRRDDGEMLMGLINRGKVYRFLMKPVSPGRARLAVEASIRHHLEAPDAAFKAVVSNAPAPTLKPATSPVATQQPAPAVNKSGPPAAGQIPVQGPEAAPANVTEPESDKPANPAPSDVTQRADPPLGELTAPKPADENRDGTFDGDDTVFTETVADTAGIADKLLESASAAAASAMSAAVPAPAKTDSAGGFRFGKPALVGAGAVVVIAIAGTLFWLMSGEVKEQGSALPAATDSTSMTESDASLATPSDEIADKQALVDEALAQVEAALLESSLDEASASLQQVADLDPENARLPFLAAQLKQIQLRSDLDAARNAIRDTRFEDAANLIASARALDLGDAAEIDVVADELAAARSEQRVDETLALAAARLEEGDLLSPVNDNARYYYELVLSNAPDNAAARQGLNVVVGKLVLQARAELDNGNFDAAENRLADASAMNVPSDELAAALTALQTARAAIAERARLAEEARRREEAERRAAAQREEAERLAAAEAEAEATRQAAADDAMPEATAAADDQEATATQAAATADSDEAAAQGTPLEPEPVPISSLTRTRYVAPKYPRGAERRGESGWVDIIFTITVDGTVKDAEVRESMPEGVFDQAAVRAAERWEFEPVIEDGRTVEKRAGVRLMFALE